MSSATVTPETAPSSYVRVQGNGPLGNHPMRQRVVDAILKGESDLSIEKWVTPRVSRITVGKLRAQVNQERQTALLAEKVRQIEALAIGNSVETRSPEEFAKLAVAGSLHNARIEKLLSPLEIQALKAHGEDDRNGLSSVVKTALAAIRLQAELDGSLTATQVNNSVTNNVLVLPFTVGQQPALPEPIDITAEPTE